MIKSKIIENKWGSFNVPLRLPVGGAPPLPDAPWNKLIAAPPISLLRENIEDGKNLVDVGACWGFVSVVVGREVMKSGGKVFSFEANPELFKLMDLNLQMNGIAGEAHHRAVFDDSRSLVCFPEPILGNEILSTYASFGVDPDRTDGWMVNAVTLDSMNLPNVGMLKIDAEGCDLKVLIGAKDLLSLHRPIIVFEYTTCATCRGANGKPYRPLREPFEDYEKFLKSVDYKIVKRVKNDYLAIPSEKVRQ
jgi:FkbM family methyltransferase